MELFKELGEWYRRGGILVRLILINVLVFLAYNLLRVIAFLLTIPGLDDLGALLAVPASLARVLHQPWSILTYMFFHTDVLHVLFNMLVLYWFGQFFLTNLRPGKLLTSYLMGGISGALLFILFYNVFPVFSRVLPMSVCLGASASVTAIMITATVFQPNFQFNFLFFGAVRAKYVVLVVLILDVISIAGNNSGGHIAHLGGAAWGFLHAFTLKSNQNPWNALSRFFRKMRPGRKPKVVYRGNVPPVDDHAYAAWKADQQKEIDRILDKISRSGYQSLSNSEKETLFRMNK